MMYGTYKDTNGAFPHLAGKRAMLQPCTYYPDAILAQFNDTSLKEAYGWHVFETAQFEIEIKDPT